MGSFYDAFDPPAVQRPATIHVLRPPYADADPYALAALNAEIERVATAANGTRNDTLNRATFSLAQLVAGGALTETTVREHLTAAAQTCGLDTDEITATLNSGFRSGIQHPRGIPETSAIDVPELTVLADDEHQRSADHTSWWYRDLAAVLSGAEPELTPTVLLRTDDKALFYPGRVNGLLGESESGKTWVALLAVAQALRDGRPVLYLDFEDSAAGIIGRLRALGVTETEMRGFAYIDPDESLGVTQQADLGDVLASHKPDLIVTDGFNAAMTLLGLNLESNTDATTFAQKLLKPLANTGATVVYIDHVPKNKDNQGKGGIGAQAKRAMTTGCAIKVEVTQEFGKGMTGHLKLTVDKDRPGHVRAVSGGAKNAGTAVLVSHADTGVVELRIDPPDLRPVEERGPFRPTVLMQKISLYLGTTQGDGVSGAEIERNISGRAQNVRHALEMLVQEGHVSRRVGPRNTVVHKSVKPFLDNSLVFDSGETAPEQRNPQQSTSSAARPVDQSPRELRISQIDPELAENSTSSTSSDLVPTSSGTGSVSKSATSSARPTPYRGDEVDEVSAHTDEPVDLVPDVRKRLRENT